MVQKEGNPNNFKMINNYAYEEKKEENEKQLSN